MQDNENLITAPKRVPWNKGKLIGPRPPLRQKHVWSIRTRLQIEQQVRDLALFNLAIDSKLRGCDVVAVKVDDVAPNGRAIERATVRQRKTGRPVRCGMFKYCGAKKIIWGVGTPRTLRVHWSMQELGLDYTCRPIGSRDGGNMSAEYTRLNPCQKIPTVQDGDLVISESAAIVNYLTTRYGGELNMQPPTDPVERSRYDRWCFFCMMELDADTLYVIRRHDDLHAVYGVAPNAVNAAREIFAKQAEAAVVLLGAGPYAMGERFTGADILLTTCLTSALRRGITLPKQLGVYLSRTTARAGYQRAIAANQRNTDEVIEIT